MILKIINLLTLFCVCSAILAQDHLHYNSFAHAQNKLVEQQFPAVFENFTQEDDTIFLAFDNQSFYWTNFENNSFLFTTDHNYPIISAKSLYAIIGQRTINKLALNLNQSKLLVVSSDIHETKCLHIIRLVNKEIVYTTKHIYDATWVDNASIFYATQSEILQFHSTLNTLKTIKQLTELPEEITFTTTWDNWVNITLNYENSNDIWLVEKSLTIVPIKLIIPNNGVFYSLSKCQNQWVCAIKSGSDYDQLLATTNINSDPFQWQSIISTTNAIYIDNLVTTPNRIFITGYEKGNAILRSYTTNFNKPKHIKFDEQLYFFDRENQPLLSQNKIIITNRNKYESGFIYNLINENIQYSISSKFDDFNGKKFTAKRSEVSWGDNIALITAIHRNRVKKPTQTILIKPVSAPKAQLRQHFSGDELKLLELGYSFILVHIMPNNSLLNITNNQSLFNFYPEVGLFYATQKVIKQNPDKNVVVLANAKGCNVVLNTMINHPTLFDAVVFNNPQFENIYANFLEQNNTDLTLGEKVFIANKKTQDPLTNINFQQYPTILFNLTNELPNKNVVAIYNKLAVQNALNNNLWFYTTLHSTHLNQNLSLIINFIKQTHF